MKTPSPFELHVAPFPAPRFESQEHQPLPDGFVDDHVIEALLTLPLSNTRVSSVPTDLVLSSDENDFAGWSVPSHSPFRVIAEHHDRAAVHPTYFAETDPGIGEPHRNGHRWWIAAVTSAASALLLSFLFTQLADRNDFGSAGFLTRSLGALQSAVGSLIP